jgi:hypothetical protein
MAGEKESLWQIFTYLIGERFCIDSIPFISERKQSAHSIMNEERNYLQ